MAAHITWQYAAVYNAVAIAGRGLLYRSPNRCGEKISHGYALICNFFFNHKFSKHGMSYQRIKRRVGRGGAGPSTTCPLSPAFLCYVLCLTESPGFFFCIYFFLKKTHRCKVLKNWVFFRKLKVYLKQRTFRQLVFRMQFAIYNSIVNCILMPCLHSEYMCKSILIITKK